MEDMKNWIEDCLWSWRNCIYFRFDRYENDIDRLAFFEELSIGHIQMEDEYIMSQPNFDPYNLSGRDPYYSYMMKK
tara:strand:- start:1306 stop:1533 length:228 start_codon:yes stop_codon:yes gene_type:complete